MLQYTTNKQSEKESKKIILLTIASKKINYLQINQTKKVKICALKLQKQPCRQLALISKLCQCSPEQHLATHGPLATQ